MWSYDFVFQILPETFLILRRIQRDMIKNVYRSSCSVPLLLSDCNGTWILRTDFRRFFKYQFSWKSVQWEQSYCIRTDGRTGSHDEANIAFRNFATAPANSATILTYLHTYLLTHLLTPWCRVLLEKLTGLQLVKKFPAFHGTQMFITALTRFRHLSLSWASPIQSIYPQPTSWRSILILSTHLRLGLPSGLLPSGFPTKMLYTPSPHIWCYYTDSNIIVFS